MSKKLVNILGITIFVCSILFAVYVFRSPIIEFFNSFTEEDIVQVNLSLEEKLEDFNFTFDILTENMLSFEDYKELYSVDFIANKDFYENEVINTKNDYEFYCVMRAMIRDIPSFHTDLVSPSTENYESLNCFNSELINTTKNYKKIAEYWDDVSKMDIGVAKFTVFEYIDGKYVDLETSGEKQLLSIDNLPIEKFIENNFSCFFRDYDHDLGQVTRSKLVFNDEIGTEIEIKYINKNDEEIVQKLYYSIYFENMWKQNYVFHDHFRYSDNYYHDDNYSYLKIDDCHTKNSSLVENEMKKIKSDNVIIDFRDNYGGNTKFCGESIYPYLFSQNIKNTNQWYIKDTIENKEIFSNIMTHLLINFKKTENTDFLYNDQEDYLYTIKNYKYKGREKSDKNVVVLTSKDTGSAADKFVSTLKNNNLATIIGENTGGEGLMDSFLSKTMPNSKLVFIYMSGKALNKDGSDNSAYGTSPNIYESLSIESHKKYIELLESEQNPYTLENQILWDDLLIKALDHMNIN